MQTRTRDFSTVIFISCQEQAEKTDAASGPGETSQQAEQGPLEPQGKSIGTVVAIIGSISLPSWANVQCQQMPASFTVRKLGADGHPSRAWAAHRVEAPSPACERQLG